ncbi:TPA: hypothetical protein HA344_01615 [Candidatus Bathyarchaeota archaeon]|nr:hypothetical protein [Candidatus Bathyarchaeota archaeon]
MGDRQVVDWLLERDQPWVRYNTLVDLLGVKRESEEARGALAEAMTTPPASKILGSLDPNGGFTDKAAARKWGEVAVRGGYVPKYRGAAWKLIFLSEIGADPCDARLRILGEKILANAFDPSFGTFNIHLEAGGRGDYALIPCFMGNMVWALCRLGFADRPEVRSAFDWLVRYQRFDDGDWKPPTSFPYKGSRERCWGKHTCYWGVTSILRAMTVVPGGFWTPESVEAKSKTMDFVLAHRLLWSSHDHTRPITVKNTRPQRLTAPLTYYQDAIEIISTMLTLGARGEEVNEAIEFVLAKRNGEGRWMLDNAPDQLDAPFGTKGGESKWITFRALRMLKFAGRFKLE